MTFRSFTLTGEQIRAARALARIEQAQLAKLSSLSLETIKRLERIRGPVEANVRTLNAIVGAFEQLGIYFEACEEGGVGVCRPPADSQGLRAPPPPRAAPEARTGSAEPVQLLQRLVYWSTAAPQDGASLRETLGDIVATARARNNQLGITGALLACNGRFLQVLEGPKEAVLQVYGSISADPRHRDLKLIDNRAASGRLFSDFSLCCGLFPSDDAAFRHEPAMREGFKPEELTPASALGLLTIVRDLQRRAPRNTRGEVKACSLACECLDRTCSAGCGANQLSDCA